MNKKLKYIIALSFVCALILVFYACKREFRSEIDGNETSQIRTRSGEGELVWNFPVQYGTPEWATLKTVEEQYNAYNIPAEILQSISTEELVKVCLAYPEWGLINAYNSRRAGFAVLVNLFNGFRELYEREDAAIELLKEYKRLDPLAVESDWEPLQQGRYSFQFTKIEMFFNFRRMIDKLDNAGIRNLKETVISKYEMKKMLPNIYSLWDFSPTVGVYLNIIEKENAAILENVPDINYFRYYLMSENIEFLDYIIKL